MKHNSTLLAVENLHTYFKTEEGIAHAVDGVSFSVPKGKTVAIVGESGSGKSVTALSILQLVPEPAGKIVKGKIFFENQNLLEFPEKQMRQIRGNKIAMIFQEPMTALNPVFTIGNQIEEALKLHRKNITKEQRKQIVIELLQKVGISEPKERIKNYPHQLSGGMRQRAMIAMALACQPKLLIADEPTTALDVTIQAQILALLNDLQTQMKMSILLITHDLGIVAQSADSVVVMYAGKVIESANVKELFENPLHPYTIGLLNAIPKLGEKKQRLDTIPGNVPNPVNFPTGCRLHPRCEKCDNDERCMNKAPKLIEHRPNHFVACWKI